MKINSKIAEEFSGLLALAKKTKDQKKRINEIWNAMKSEPVGKHEAGNFTFVVSNRKAGKIKRKGKVFARKSGKSVMFRAKKLAPPVSFAPKKVIKTTVKKAA